jgi:hypothetical protein
MFQYVEIDVLVIFLSLRMQEVAHTNFNYTPMLLICQRHLLVKTFSVMSTCRDKIPCFYSAGCYTMVCHCALLGLEFESSENSKLGCLIIG